MKTLLSHLESSHTSPLLLLQTQPGGTRKRPDSPACLRSEEVNVILHKDKCHQPPCVAAMISEIIAALKESHAITVAEKAFTAGQAVVIACAKADAERYRDQLTEQYQLIVTLETA